MSKYVSNELFAKFQKRTKEDADRKQSAQFQKSDTVWKPKEKGTEDNPKVYKLRLLPDPNNKFYEKAMYHMFKVGGPSGKWSYSLCPKTFDFEAYCPICDVVSKLWMGTEADKNDARRLKRKEKYVVNAFVVDDPCDDTRDAEDKVTGKVKIYDFPSKVEDKIRDAINDGDEGVGLSGFDPSEDGFNFLLKMGSTKPQADNKSWPDYGLSKFARNPGPIAENDSEIDAIMETRHDLEAHLKTELRAEDQIIKALRDEGFYEYIKDKVGGSTSSSEIEDKPAPRSTKQEVTDPEEELKREKVEAPTGEDNEIQEDLLAQLDNI